MSKRIYKGRRIKPPAKGYNAKRATQQMKKMLRPYGLKVPK